MKFYHFLAMSVILTAILSSCGGNEKTARNGLKYTVLREGNGKVSEEGNYLILNLSFKDKVTDSLWRDTGESTPQALMQSDSLWLAQPGDIQVIFGEMNEGDSVTFDVSVADFFANTVRNPVPPGLNAEDMIQFNVGLLHVFTQEEAMAWAEEKMNEERARMEAEAAVQLEKDIQIIENYLSENNITTESTESGVYYEILEEGSGTQPANGATVKVNYAGRLISGELFDTNIPEVAKENNVYREARPYRPFEFTLGMGEVIRGWDVGIAQLNEGTKARLYIPSTLGYGPQGNGGVIGPNSILVFDVELVEVN